MAHDQYSPSRRHQFAYCPGSIREQAKYPEGPSGPAAADGTHSHTLLEHCLKNNADPLKMVGVKLSDHEGEFIIDRDRADRVQVALDYIAQRATEDDVTVLAEARVDPEFFIDRSGCSGTVDVQIIYPNKRIYEIVDYKDGVAPTDAIEQLEQYAVGGLAQLKIPHNLPYPYDTVRLTVIQPKLRFKGMNPITTVEKPVKYFLDDVVGKLAAELANATAPDAPLVPGEKQCKYCRAKGACSALANQVMSEVKVMFQPVNSPMDVATQAANKDPAVMDSAQLVQIMEAAPLLRQLLDAVEAEAKRRLESGQAVPGLKLVHGRGSRVWAESDEAMEEKLIKCGIPKGSVYVTKLVSPAQAEKLSWEKRDGTKCQLTKKQIERINEYTTKLAGKLTVVPESDSRPAVVVDAAPLFSAVTNELPDWLK